MEKVRPLPAYAIAIIKTRTHFNWTQAEMAENLGIGQAEISRWEKGKREPARHLYEELYVLAHDLPEASLFWEKAELTPQRMDRWLTAMKHGREAPVLKRESPTATPDIINPWRNLKQSAGIPTAVPLLADAAAAGVPRIVRETDIEDIIFFSSVHLPHPLTTRCIRISGDSMHPVLEDGDIVAVDTYKASPHELASKMVVASDPSGGITVKWLRKVGKEYILMPQNPRFDPILLRSDPGWRIVGEVLFWIGMPHTSEKPHWPPSPPKMGKRWGG